MFPFYIDVSFSLFSDTVQHWPGGSEHQAEDAIRVLGQFLQHWQHKSRCLPTSSLSTAHAVLTCDDKQTGKTLLKACIYNAL